MNGSEMKEPDTRIVHQQIALLEDLQGQSLQTRFEEFCRTAMDALTQVNPHGEPILEAGKAKASLTLQVNVIRTADDALTFAIDHELRTKLPRIPCKSRSAPFVRGIGLAQRVKADQLPLFDPKQGQPRPFEPGEANDMLG